MDTPKKVMFQKVCLVGLNYWPDEYVFLPLVAGLNLLFPHFNMPRAAKIAKIFEARRHC
jgi:hypothetical protein